MFAAHHLLEKEVTRNMLQYDEKMAWLNDGLKVLLSILSVSDSYFLVEFCLEMILQVQIHPE